MRHILWSLTQAMRDLFLSEMRYIRNLVLRQGEVELRILIP